MAGAGIWWAGRRTKPEFLRQVVQWAFLLWCVAAGVLFGFFVAHYRGAAVLLVVRPPSVEGFLPVGALVSLRHFLLSGEIHPFHPAALILLLTFLGMSLLAKRAFCSFVCPVAPLSEVLGKAGRKLFRRDFFPRRWLDVSLRALKYALLAFFLWQVFLLMDPGSVETFLDSPYWAGADVRMLDFFLRMSLPAAAAFLLLAAFSLLLPDFWCRYLCPYGALTGLLSLLSPWKVHRDASVCTGCGTCGQVCPSRLPVDEKKVVRSAECTGCLTCVSRCPEKAALRMGFLWYTGALPWWAYPAVVLSLFALGVGLGMGTGHWHTSLTDSDWRILIP